MIAVWIALALAVVIVGLGHLRLVDRQADVAAARRRIEALWQRRALLADADAASALDGRLAALVQIHAAELTRYRRTPGARINRWRPRALPVGVERLSNESGRGLPTDAAEAGAGE